MENYESLDALHPGGVETYLALLMLRFVTDTDDKM